MRLGLALLLGALAGLLAAPQPIGDTDMWWHLATGRATLEQGFVRTDLFSWSVHGSPITTDQWLGQILMYGSYVAFGWRGIALLRVVLLTALVGLTAWSAGGRSTRPLAIVLATLPALLLTRPIAVDRPELAGFVFFAAMLVLLRLARDGRTTALAGVVLLLGIWTNVHGSFALGALLTLIVCADGALTDASRRRAYVVAGVAALAVTLVNPAGVGVWTAPGVHLLSPPREIQEWSVIDVRTPLGLVYLGTLLVFVACAFVGPRVARREIVVLIPIALLSMTAARQAPLLAIAASPLFADRAERVLSRMTAPAAARRAGQIAIATAAAVLLAAMIATPTDPDTHAYPVAARNSIPTGDGLLARYEWGGYLIWSGLSVYVDGRLTPYRGAVLDDYTRIVSAAPGWRDVIARRGVRSLLVAPSDPVATRAAELGWSIRSRSNDAVLIAVP